MSIFDLAPAASNVNRSPERDKQSPVWDALREPGPENKNGSIACDHKGNCKCTPKADPAHNCGPNCEEHGLNTSETKSGCCSEKGTHSHSATEGLAGGKFKGGVFIKPGKSVAAPLGRDVNGSSGFKEHVHDPSGTCCGGTKDFAKGVSSQNGFNHPMRGPETGVAKRNSCCQNGPCPNHATQVQINQRATPFTEHVNNIPRRPQDLASRDLGATYHQRKTTQDALQPEKPLPVPLQNNRIAEVYKHFAEREVQKSSPTVNSQYLRFERPFDRMQPVPLQAQAPVKAPFYSTEAAQTIAQSQYTLRRNAEYISHQRQLEHMYAEKRKVSEQETSNKANFKRIDAPLITERISRVSLLREPTQVRQVFASTKSPLTKPAGLKEVSVIKARSAHTSTTSRSFLPQTGVSARFDRVAVSTSVKQPMSLQSVVISPNFRQAIATAVTNMPTNRTEATKGGAEKWRSSESSIKNAAWPSKQFSGFGRATDYESRNFEPRKVNLPVRETDRNELSNMLTRAPSLKSKLSSIVRSFEPATREIRASKQILEKISQVSKNKLPREKTWFQAVVNYKTNSYAALQSKFNQMLQKLSSISLKNLKNTERLTLSILKAVKLYKLEPKVFRAKDLEKKGRGQEIDPDIKKSLKEVGIFKNMPSKEERLILSASTKELIRYFRKNIQTLEDQELWLYLLMLTSIKKKKNLDIEEDIFELLNEITTGKDSGKSFNLKLIYVLEYILQYYSDRLDLSQQKFLGNKLRLQKLRLAEQQVN